MLSVISSNSYEDTASQRLRKQTNSVNPKAADLTLAPGQQPGLEN